MQGKQNLKHYARAMIHVGFFNDVMSVLGKMCMVVILIMFPSAYVYGSGVGATGGEFWIPAFFFLFFTGITFVTFFASTIVYSEKKEAGKHAAYSKWIFKVSGILLLVEFVIVISFLILMFG